MRLLIVLIGLVACVASNAEEQVRLGCRAFSYSKIQDSITRTGEPGRDSYWVFDLTYDSAGGVTATSEDFERFSGLDIGTFYGEIGERWIELSAQNYYMEREGIRVSVRLNRHSSAFSVTRDEPKLDKVEVWDGACKKLETPLF